MAESKFNGVVDSLMKGMETMLSTHTVVGEPRQVGDTVILPLVDVAFGVGAGANDADRKNAGNGGFGAKMSPSAILMIQNGQTKLVNIKNQDAVTKILDLVPDVVNRFSQMGGDAVTNEEARSAAFGDTADAKKEG